MKILHISAASESTGAGKAVLLTHKGLLQLGFDSRILFLKSDLIADNIFSYHKMGISNRIIRFLYTFLDSLPLLIYRSKKKEIFSNAWIGIPLKNNRLIVWADLIHIHWANHGFISLHDMKSWGKPIVWTMRDMWVFTGGCHYSFDCKNYENNCGSCPALGSTNAKDISFYNFQRKVKNLSEISITWVAISHWLKNAAHKSATLHNQRVELVYSGVDASYFSIRDKNSCRVKYGLNTSLKTILIGATDIRQEYKGFEFLISILNQISEDILVITFGSTTFNEGEIRQKSLHFGVSSNEVLLELYNLSDIFVAPSIAEAMGKTVLEAQLCGLPVLSFNDTGPASIISHMETGYLAKFKNSFDLFKGLQFCLQHDWNRELIRERVTVKFDILNICQQYTSIYEKSIMDWTNN